MSVTIENIQTLKFKPIPLIYETCYLVGKHKMQDIVEKEDLAWRPSDVLSDQDCNLFTRILKLFVLLTISK